MGTGIRAIVSLSVLYIFCFGCNQRTNKNTPEEETSYYADIFYEKDVSPWNYTSCWFMGVDHFLTQKESLRLLRTEDRVFLDSLWNAIHSGRPVGQNGLDAHVVVLMHSDSQTDTLVLSEFPHFGYEFNTTVFQNDDVYCVVVRYILNNDTAFKGDILSTLDLIPDDYRDSLYRRLFEKTD